MVQEIILAQEGGVLQREIDEFGQMQLALHKLKRAKLEVAYYSHAIAKVANAMKVAASLRGQADRDDGKSGFSTTNEILTSYQVGVVIIPIATKTRPPALEVDDGTICW